MHRQRLTHRCVGNAGSSLAVIWFQLGSNEGPLNRRFFGISGADSTVLQFVNSRNDRKSKCPIWCRLREIGSHFSFFSCTHTCTHGYDFRIDGCQSAIRFVEVADLLSLPTTGLLARIASEYAVIQAKSSRFRPFAIFAITTLQPAGLLPAA